MRLLRCHIENFGILRDYDCEFKDGLNTIYKENGFGKSTLAVFIKSMLYGIKGSRAKNENDRRHYKPWQGGAYGGYLEFEHEGIRYRVTRSFGSTPIKDSFGLEDLTNHKKIEGFTESLGSLGERTFGLDAESFSRSTYLPQLKLDNIEVSPNLQSSLSNLVDNTDDMNNYDSASAALRNVRTTYKAFKGSGGKIPELDKSIHELENNKYKAEGVRPRYTAISEKINQLKSKKSSINKEISILHEKISEASEARELKFKQDRLRNLMDEAEAKEQKLRELKLKYPEGCPTVEEINCQRQNLSIIRQAEEKIRDLRFPQDDREKADRDRDIFADADKVSMDIDRCGSLSAELIELKVRMEHQKPSGEELDRLNELSQRFRGGLPAEAELKAALNAADKINAAQMELGMPVLSPRETGQYESLRAFFKDGVPSERELKLAGQDIYERNMLLNRRELKSMPQKDQIELARLKDMFAGDMPGGQDIGGSRKGEKTPRVCWLLGAAGALIIVVGMLITVAGIILMLNGSSGTGVSAMPGGVSGLLPGLAGLHPVIRNLGLIALALGLAALITAFFIKRASGQKAAMKEKELLDEVNAEIHDLRRDFSDFPLNFYPDASESGVKLNELLYDLRKFRELEEERIAAERELADIDREIEVRNHRLYALHDRFYRGQTYGDDFVETLRTEVRIYAGLLTRIKEADERHRGLVAQVSQLKTKITALLDRYYPGAAHNNLRENLQRLSLDASEYIELRKRYEASLAEYGKSKSRYDEVYGQARSILLSYRSYDPSHTLSDDLARLRARLNDYNLAMERLGNYEKEINEAETKARNAKAEIRKFLDRYRIQTLGSDYPAAASLSDIETFIEQAYKDISTEEALTAGLKEARERLEAYLRDNPDITVQPSGAVGNFQETAGVSGRPAGMTAQAEGTDSIARMPAEVSERSTGIIALAEGADDITRTAADNLESPKIAAPTGTSGDAVLMSTSGITSENLDIAKLNGRERLLHEEINGIDESLNAKIRERDGLCAILEEIPSIEDKIKFKKVEKDAAEKKLYIIDQTMGYLEKAKDRLANSYLDKIERGYEKYARILNGGEASHVMVDKELKPYVDEQGSSREIGSFSAGMKDVIMLCMRLALVDALFENEKPFLILDDPFVNLDDKHTEWAIQMLKKISGHYQVIYLVCNSSRAV